MGLLEESTCVEVLVHLYYLIESNIFPLHNIVEWEETCECQLRHGHGKGFILENSIICYYD